MTQTPPPDPNQPPYGQVPPPPAPPPPAPPNPGQYPPQYPPAYGQPVYFAQPNHPSATTALVLGILGLVVCPLVLSIPAWVIGSRAVREIDASQGQLGGRGNAKAGYVLGIIGTVWAGVSALFVIGVFAFGGVISHTFEDTCTTVGNDSGFTTQC